jgi:hypothetical protein
MTCRQGNDLIALTEKECRAEGNERVSVLLS